MAYDPLSESPLPGTRPFELPDESPRQSGAPASIFTRPAAPGGGAAETPDSFLQTSAPAEPTPAGRSLFTDPREAERLRAALPADAPSADETATLFGLAAKTGLPFDFIRRHRAEVERELVKRDFDPERFRRESPLLAAWVASDQHHAALVQDDVFALTGLERALRFGENSARAAGAGALRFSSGFYGVLEGVSDAAGLPGLGAWFRGLGEHPRNLAATVRGDQAGAGPTERAFYSGMESLGLTATTIPLAVMGGGPGPMLGALGGVTAGEEYSDARRQGLGVAPALVYGASQGLIEVATERIPVGKLVADISRRTPFLTTLVRQGVAEIPGEQIATFLQDLNAWAALPVNADKTVADYLAARPRAIADTLIATLVAVGGQTTIARATQRTLEALGQAAEDSKTAQRAPAKFQEFIDQATRGSAVETVFLPVRSFVEYFQEADPVAVAAQLTGDPQALTRAVETGADLAVPMAAYVTQLGADRQHRAFFSQEARFAPDALNAREEADLEARAGAAVRQAVEAGATPAPAAAVGESVRDQLEQAGYAPGVARTNAALVESLFATLHGTRLGQDPVEAFEGYRLAVVRSGLAEAPTRPDVPADTYQRLFDQAVAAARETGYTGSTDALRFAFDTALGEAVALVRDVQATDADRTPVALMRAIAAAGGIGQDEVHAGELARLWESSTGNIVGRGVTKSGRVKRSRRLATGGMLGVPHVLRQKGGHDLDTIAESLREDPAFAHLEGPRDLLQAIDEALVNEPVGRSLEQALAQIGVTPGQRWWQREFLQEDDAPAPVVVVTEDELGPLDATDLAAARARVWTLYRTTVQSRVTVTRAELGDRPVRFTRAGGKNFVSKSGDPDKLRLATSLPTILERARYVGARDVSKPRRDEIARFHRFEATVDIAGRARPVAVLVAEYGDGPLSFFDLYFPGIETAPTDRQILAPGPEPPKGGGATFEQSMEDGGEPVNPPGRRREPRGAIRFSPTGAVQIELFARSNLSTFLHESGHFFLEVFADAAEQLAAADPETLTASERQVLSDYATALTWLGVERREDITRDHHERWARGLEAYLMEGRAPSIELRPVFARVRTWLVQLYRSLRRLRVELTPEVRGVMDRLLATDEAIAAAARESSLHVPLLTDELAAEVGLTREERDAYAATVHAAMDQARDQVQGRLMAELRREREGWWAEERVGVRAEQAVRLAEEPVYKALALLQYGLDADGQPLPDGVAFQLDQAALVRSFGPEVLAQLPRPLVYVDEGGLAPAVAAGLLGYDSAPALVQALTTAAPFEAAVEAATDAEMRRRHGDLRRDGTVDEIAERAVLDAGAEVFAAEARMLEQLAVRQGTEPLAPTAPIGTLRAIADRRIRETKIRDLKPGLFAAAARRAGQRALEAAGRRDFAGALAAKQQQLLNAELHRAATEARERVDEARGRFRKIWAKDESLAPRYNMDLVAAARALLVQHGFAAPQIGVESVWTYLGQVKEYDPVTYGDLEAAIDAAGGPPVPFRDLTVEAFEGLRDAIDNVLHLARRSRQIVLEGKAEEIADVAAGLSAQLDDFPQYAVGYARAASKWEKTKRGLMGVRAYLRRAEFWVDAIDGGDLRGKFRRAIWTPVSDAAAGYRLAKKSTLERYLAIVKGVEASLTTDEIPAPELGYTFAGKVELLHAILHTGNASNRSKLLRGRGWGFELPDGSVDETRWRQFVERLWASGVLTKADYDYVQQVWDLLGELKPEAQRVHHALYGYYFSEVTAEAFDTPFGRYAGGYVPALVDPFLDDASAVRADREAVDQTPNSFMFPSTGRGFTKKRIEIYARPLALNLGLIPLHLDRVLRFIHLQPAVKDVGRLLIHKPLRTALGNVDPTVAGELLVPWLQRTAQQLVEQPATGWGGRAGARFFRTLRTRTGLNIMTANVVNTLQQASGLSLAAVKVPPGALGRALWGFVRAPRETADAVAEKSIFMRTRTSTQVIEIQQQLEELLVNPSKYEQARRFAEKHGYFLQAGAQSIVDVITWRGAYDTAVADGATEPEAVRAGDAAVRQTQGSFNPEDLSRLETGSALSRAFTMFYSYFNMQANLVVTEATTTWRALGVRAGAGRLLYLYAFGFLIPAVVSELIVQGLSGQLGDDEDEDGLIWELLNVFFGGQLRTATAFVPGGQAVQAVFNAFNDRWYDDRISVSPAVSALESLARSPKAVYDSLVDGTLKRRDVRDVLTAIGLLTGLPTAAAGRPLGYLADVAEGNEPESPADVARGLIVGR